MQQVLGGREWARPPPRGLPRATAQRQIDAFSSVCFRFRACAVAFALVFLLSLYYVYYDGVCVLKAGQASGPKPSGYK